ncbi:MULTISPECIES: GIY-YIG nuclease family protein [Echinicola]|uniref:Putative endonuclease containing a URI domain n=1 Tax=Echinicola vietnamensis (strain DSM 17526 / LMG 23754 / KMM 6221) TaxID=926556 RepID=L0G497_ECHVK|nr:MULTISPECIES: GIY-YIG nuclease family protein [Echinicola]AGA79650.1 putative endonuclease containing a URI domain [Echinicola vietnamensis DSM 17526]
MTPLFSVYVLFSPSYGKTYTGMTSDLINRFHSHNSFAKKGFTVKYRPWIMIHVEYFHHKSNALRREKELKSGKGREWIKQHILPLYTN